MRAAAAKLILHQITQDAPEQGRMCPRCNNGMLPPPFQLDFLKARPLISASVVGAHSRMWFEFFWIPLIPFPKSRIWVCGICRESLSISTVRTRG